MPGKKSRGQAPLQRLWNEWGVFLLLAAVIIVAGTLAIVLNARRNGGSQIVPQAPYKLYFTQGDLGEPAPGGLLAEIRKDIAAARSTVEVATPGLDLPLLADELIAAQGRGVTVRILEDAARREAPGVAAVSEQLHQAGLEVVWRQAQGALGGSFVVIDQRLVWAGSWDLSSRGLDVDDGLVIRWEMTQLGKDFHDEFMEMYADRAYGPTSPTNTTFSYLAIPDVSSISVYMTPEDEYLSEVLQTLAKAKGAILLISGGISDPRLGERLAGEGLSAYVSFYGVVSGADSSADVLDALKGAAENLFDYRGTGELRENVIVIDGEVSCIFSQPLHRAGLDQNDGYLFILLDKKIASLLQQEFGRLAQKSPETP